MAQDVIPLAKRRRLADLYVRGKELEIDDGSGEGSVVVWVHKISPLENKNAMDLANAARARLMAARFAEDDDQIRLALSSEAEMSGLFSSRETICDYIYSAELLKARQSHEAELGADEEWSKNDYLEGLRTSWHGTDDTEGLKDKYALNPEDPEAAPVFAELKRFVQHVEELLERDRGRFRREEDRTTDQELRHRVIDMLIENEADQVWYSEYKKQQVFYSVREPSLHEQRYFQSVEELDKLDVKVLKTLMDTFEEVNVEPAEGKD